MNTIIANIYRPPNASSVSFENMVHFLSEYINETTQEKHFDIIIMGDINLPNINWENSDISKTMGEDATKSADSILNFMSNHLLSQIIKKPTRGNNTLMFI